MKVQDMILELDDNGFEDTGIVRQLGMLQDTIWEIEDLEPWPFLEDSTVLDADGTDVLAAPADFRAVLSLKDRKTGQRLTPIRPEDLEEAVGTQDTESGDPRFYWFLASEIHVWPIPKASTGRYNLRYIRKSDPIIQSSVETDILLPREDHRVIVVGTLAKLYTMEDDPEQAVAFKNEYDERLVKMRGTYVEMDPSQWDANLDVRVKIAIGAGLDEDKAIALMVAQPSMIKRPVLESAGPLLVGFKPDTYLAAGLG